MTNKKFYCENRKFKTDTSKGFKGSVTKKPIWKDESYVIRLEYVYEFKKPDNELFWLMWYDINGRPLLKASSVFDRDDLLTIMKNISEIKF